MHFFFEKFLKILCSLQLSNSIWNGVAECSLQSEKNMHSKLSQLWLFVFFTDLRADKEHTVDLPTDSTAITFNTYSVLIYQNNVQIQ